MDMKYGAMEYCVMIVLVSFLGFALENCWLILTHGYMDNRNMTLPFLVGYGLTIVGFYLVVGTPDNLRITEWFGVSIDRTTGFIIYFLISFVLISIGEILLGTFVEHKFGFEYWNYSFLPLNVTKYTSLPTSTGFALMLTLFMGYCFIPIMKRIKSMPGAVKVIAVLLVALLLMDLFISFRTMYNNHSLNVRWTKEVWKGIFNRK